MAKSVAQPPTKSQFQGPEFSHTFQFGTRRQLEKLGLHVAEDSLPQITVATTPGWVPIA